MRYNIYSYVCDTIYTIMYVYAIYTLMYDVWWRKIFRQTSTSSKERKETEQERRGLSAVRVEHMGLGDTIHTSFLTLDPNRKHDVCSPVAKRMEILPMEVGGRRIWGTSPFPDILQDPQFALLSCVSGYDTE